MKNVWKNALCVFLSFCFIFAGSLPLLILGNKSIIVNIEPTVKNLIIIDPGHGGFDGGAVAGDGTVEKDINLEISLKLGTILEFYGFEVIYTRTVDDSVDNKTGEKISNRKKSDLNNRLELINSNKDALFVSIHLNKFTSGSANGAQVFYSPNNKSSKKLAQCLQSEIKTLLQNDNNRAIKKADKSIYLLHNALSPAVIVECGFLSNNKELKLLKDEEYQAKMAFSIFSGILKYFSNSEVKEWQNA